MCVQRTGSDFCPNSRDLGQEHAGSSTALAGGQAGGGEGGKQDLGAWVEVWTPCRGIKQYAVSKRLSELQPCAGKYPGGRDVGEAERSFLSGCESTTGAGHSFKRNPDRQQELAGGMVARNQVRSKS